MLNLRQRSWFRIIAILLINFFILAQSSYALNIDDKLIQQQTSENKESVQMNGEQKIVVSAYNEISTQGSSSQNQAAEIDFDSVVNALEDCPAEIKASTLKAMGCSMGKAATVLIGSGLSAIEAKNVMVKAGYDKGKVSDFLGTIIEKTQETVKADEASVAIVENAAQEKTVITPAPAAVTAGSAAGQAVETVAVKTAETVDTNKAGKADYASLSGQGLNDEQIVSSLKQQGVSADDVLRSASDLGKDMTAVAKAMQKAGYTNKEIAGAFVSKAMNWTKGATAEMINCAVQSLSAMLSGQGNMVSTIELAYEVIVNDVLQTGSVKIENGQIMSSMSAIQQTAKAHGVDLQGVKGTMADLESLSGSAIAHVDGNHWVTVTDVKGNNVTVIDNGKKVTMSKAEFQSRWDGNMLTQEKTNGLALTAQQMASILGADIGDANGNSHGAGNEDGHDGTGDMGGGHESDHGGGGSESSGGWGGFCDSVSNAVSSIGEAIGSAFGAVGEAVSGAFGAVSDFGKTVSGWGQSISNWGKDQGGIVGGLAQVAGGVVNGVGKGISGLGNIGTAAVDGFSNMSAAGKVATVVGTCFGVPCLGMVVEMGINTYKGMKAGNSFSDSLSEAFDGSLAGKAVDAMLDNPVANGLKDLGNMALAIGDKIQEQGKAMVEDGTKKGGITGALTQGLGYAMQGVGFVADAAVHGVAVAGKSMIGGATAVATAPIDAINGVCNIGSGIMNKDMGKVKEGFKDLGIAGLKAGTAYVGSQIATGIAVNIATEVAMTGSVPAGTIAALGGAGMIAGVVDAKTEGKLGDFAMGNMNAFGNSSPANVNVNNSLASIDPNGSENELLIRPLMPAF